MSDKGKPLIGEAGWVTPEALRQFVDQRSAEPVRPHVDPEVLRQGVPNYLHRVADRIDFTPAKLTYDHVCALKDISERLAALSAFAESTDDISALKAALAVALGRAA
jgi:hypothetical protein